MKRFIKRINKSVSMTSFVLGALVVIACQKPVDSKTSFIFKSAPTKGVVAKVGAEEISEKEFTKGMEGDLYEAEMKIYEIKFARLQAMLLERFMNQDPDKKNLTNDEFLDKHIAKGIKISDSEIEKFIKDRQIPKDQVNPEIRTRITDYLMMEAKKKAVDKWLAEKMKKTPVEVYFEKPTLPVFEVAVGDSPAKGKPNAPITIVEFSDFQCPFCSKASKTVEDIEKKYGNKVRIVFKHYPLPFHSQAQIAAEASLCANEQKGEYFWKLHDLMFADQSKLDRTNLIASAKKAGVKEDQFVACLDSGKFKSKVTADVTQGQDLGIKSTPTFYINGKLVSGAQPIEVFSDIIDQELSK